MPKKIDVKDLSKDMAKQYGIDLATDAGQAFARWLAERPRIARRKWLAKLLWTLSGGKGTSDRPE